jgi:hypothetical protein
LLLTEIGEVQRELSPHLGESLSRNADAARFGNAFEARCDVYAIAVDAHLVVDDIAEVNANSELHAVLRVYVGVALGHGLLDGKRTLDSVHDASELGEDAVAGGIDDTPAVLRNNREHDRLMALEIADSSFFVGAHEGAVAGDVGREDCCQFAGNLGIFGRIYHTARGLFRLRALD